MTSLLAWIRTASRSLYLEEYDRGIVLNKTNAKAVARIYGDDETTWPGKQLVLRTEPVSFKGETTNAIRMQAAPAPRKRKRPPK